MKYLKWWFQREIWMKISLKKYKNMRPNLKELPKTEYLYQHGLSNTFYNVW